LKNYAGLVPDINRYAPPEVSKTGWEIIRKNPTSATDSYDFGLLMYEVFNNGELDMDQPANQTKNIPPSMQQPYKRLFNANPKARLSVTSFLEQGKRNGGFFETPLIRLSEGVESMGLKTDMEREELLR
jgi:SCY1-like protein 1